ncbi:J domain-containing protein [Longimicrobium sp.]|uniref:J domain-containing protein n=1 Tax=Longimicrobium sp. TaxID=2029185 RepID=UPI002C4E69C8|nr:J domain-containing protein [Longimicrobium sp.]HSU17716.1 J domain-containing protein [Longimicrobium sp.]
MPTLTDAPATITAAALLAIPAWQPEKLFSGDDERDRRLYRRLALDFHPDRHPANTESFKHLSALKNARDTKIEAKTWTGAGVRELVLRSGKRLVVRYLRRHTFELGTLFISPRSVTYLFREDHRALCRNAVRTIRGFRYANDAMRDEVSRFLPRIELEAETADGPALVIAKSPGVIRLRDVLDHLGGRMDPRHVAWILSTLHNLGAYLTWAGLTHNAIDLDSYFISPNDHAGMLLGGWWYARREGEAMTHLPGASVNVWKTILPPHATAAKRATPKLDRELIRLAGRTLLGDPGGTRLLRDPAIPAPLARWVTTPGDDDGIEDYANWARARDAAFGPRRFVVMDLTPQEIYGGA